MNSCSVVVNGERVGETTGATEEGSMQQALIMYDVFTQLFVQYPTNTTKLRAAIIAAIPVWEKWNKAA